MSTSKREFASYEAGFEAGWRDGWDARESFIEHQLMVRDPGFLAWLDKLNRLSLVARERDELRLQQQQWAAQQADDDCAH